MSGWRLKVQGKPKFILSLDYNRLYSYITSASRENLKKRKRLSIERRRERLWEFLPVLFFRIWMRMASRRVTKMPSRRLMQCRLEKWNISNFPRHGTFTTPKKFSFFNEGKQFFLGGNDDRQFTGAKVSEKSSRFFTVDPARSSDDPDDGTDISQHRHRKLDVTISSSSSFCLFRCCKHSAVGQLADKTKNGLSFVTSIHTFLLFLYTIDIFDKRCWTACLTTKNKSVDWGLSRNCLFRERSNSKLKCR